jgi:hypothetical protein
MALAFITSYMMIPQLFLNDKTIVIKNNFVNIKIPFDDINTIEENPKIGLNIRTMGVGGLLGILDISMETMFGMLPISITK